MFSPRVETCEPYADIYEHMNGITLSGRSEGLAVRTPRVQLVSLTYV